MLRACFIPVICLALVGICFEHSSGALGRMIPNLHILSNGCFFFFGFMFFVFFMATYSIITVSKWMAELWLMHAASGEQPSYVFMFPFIIVFSLLFRNINQSPSGGLLFQSMWLMQEIVCELPSSLGGNSNTPTMCKEHSCFLILTIRKETPY